MKDGPIKNAAAGIAEGGGVAAKVLVRGPNQERWIRLLAKVDEREVHYAIRALVRRANGNVLNAARYLGVRPEVLRPYVDASTTKANGFGRHPEAGPLPPYRTPSTVAEILPIVGASGGVGSGKGGVGTGAWRVYELLASRSAVVSAAAVLAIRQVAEHCRTIGEVAEKLGVTRALLWRWRREFPELDAFVLSREDGERRGQVKLRAGKDRKRRLSLEDGIRLMTPYLPGTPTEVAERVADAARQGLAPHGVVPTRRELAFYVGKPGKDGWMVGRFADRRGEKVERIWALVDTKTGGRRDQRPPRREHRCSLCGGSGHNRLKCPKGKGTGDAEKTTGPPEDRVGRLRRGPGAAPPGAPKGRAPSAKG